MSMRRTVTADTPGRARQRSRGGIFVASSNAKARKYGLPDRLHLADIPSLPLGPCTYCGGAADGWDHVEPLSRGGANRLENIARACMECNRRKSNRSADSLNDPFMYSLLCGWCWAPVQVIGRWVRGAEKRGRRYFFCSVEHRNKMHSWRGRHGDLRKVLRAA